MNNRKNRVFGVGTNGLIIFEDNWITRSHVTLVSESGVEYAVLSHLEITIDEPVGSFFKEKKHSAVILFDAVGRIKCGDLFVAKYSVYTEKIK